MADALCADDPEPDRWFPHQGQHKDVQQLKLICGVCPVVEDCLLYALKSTEPLIGIWGGTTTTERRALRREVERTFHVKHGLYRYKFKKCRCPICTKANAEAKARVRANQKEKANREALSA
jgi:WhiB family redox-sensing transcriptional regulator